MIIFAICTLVALMGAITQWLIPLLKSMFRRRIYYSPYLQQYTEARILYNEQYGDVPGIVYINELDSTLAFGYIQSYYAADIMRIYQYSQYDHADGEVRFSISIIVLRGQRMVEIGNGYAEVLYGNGDYAFAAALIKELAAFRISEAMAITAPLAPATITGFMRQQAMN